MRRDELLDDRFLAGRQRDLQRLPVVQIDHQVRAVDRRVEGDVIGVLPFTPLIARLVGAVELAEGENGQRGGIADTRWAAVEFGFVGQRVQCAVAALVQCAQQRRGGIREQVEQRIERCKGDRAVLVRWCSLGARRFKLILGGMVGSAVGS